jgi:3'(2'), 5'-bisphosphate nucleotidase
MDLTRELELATGLARAAGVAAMAHYGTTEAETKAGGSPVTAADHASNDVILDGLRRAFPQDAILSEESKDDPARLAARRVWIVDPLDGTKEFLSRNGEFSVMIGLVVEGEAVLGVVYRPTTDVLYAAGRGAGAWREADGERIAMRPAAARTDALRMVGSRSHHDPLLEEMRQALGIEDVEPSGSVGIKCALIAENHRDVYIHPVPYLKEWDTCAPEVILREAGGTVTDCLGERLQYNKSDPRQPHGIVATAPGIHDEVLRAIEPLYRAAGSAKT